MKTVKERLSWFHRFMPLYERASPVIRYIANLERLRAGELPSSPNMLIESSIMLRPMLHVIQKMPKPKEKELAIIQREFELALNNCIKAAEWTEKYVNRRDYGTDGQILLGMIVNTVVLAREYIESVSKRLEPYLEQKDTSTN